jgi:hypothetical protein
MVYNIQDYCVFGLYPPSSTLKHMTFWKLTLLLKCCVVLFSIPDAGQGQNPSNPLHIHETKICYSLKVCDNG